MKRFKSFRKKLILDYKKGDKHSHTNPHALPLELKQSLVNVYSESLRQKRAEIGRRFDSYNAEASLPLVDSQSTVAIVEIRVYISTRQTPNLRHSKYRWFLTQALCRISRPKTERRLALASKESQSVEDSKNEKLIEASRE